MSNDDDIYYWLDYFTTKPDIQEYSDPIEVQRRAFRLLDARIAYSPRKNKKYRIVNPYTNKYVDFGEMGYRDGTFKDEDQKERIRRFKLRNHKWKNADPYTPAFLSYYLLW